MTSERVKDIFARAEPLPRGQRTALLDAELGDDAEARARVEAMLSASDSVSDDAFAPLVAPPGETPVQADTPERVGPYRVESLLGRGGMACVYRAVQDRPIRREVALKVVRPGFDTQAVLSRFDSERRALARLEHRHIATVLDAGADPYGPSWFSMTLVDGPPVTEYCEEQGLRFRERLALFVQICRGVQHAHTRGILHRDLKPSNILVSREDGEAVPKIIDFGVAKALGADSALGDVQQTLDTQIVGTLDYMSPEQASFGNPDVDARSDVYALGVILYELLTGRVPIGGDAFKGVPLDGIQLLIQTSRPAKPSSISHVNSPLDFDCVALKALEKSPGDRYDSAKEFADDIDRYLEGRPLAIRPPTRLYVLMRFASRNKPLVAGAAAALGLLLVGFVGTSIGLYREQRVAAELRRNEQALTAALRHAEQLGALTRDIFFGIRPERDGRDVTLREVMADAAREQLASPTEPTYANAAFARSLMDPLWTLGEFELSLGMAQRVVDWAGPEPDGRDPLMLAEGLWRRGHARSRLGDGDGAYEDFIACMTVADGLEEPGAVLRYRARLALGEWHDVRAQYERGLELKLQALTLLDEIDPDNDSDRGVILGQIGRSYSQLGDNRTALDFAERGLRLRESIATPGDLQVLTLQRNVALVAMDAGDYGRAAAILEPHVPQIIEALGPESTAALYSSVLLGSSEARLGTKPADQVLGDLRNTVEIAERVTPPRLSLFLRAYEVNAMLAYGRVDEALTSTEALLADGEAAFGASHDRQYQLRLMLATELVEYAHWTLAIERLEQLLTDLAESRGDDDALANHVRGSLARARNGASAEAVPARAD